MSTTPPHILDEPRSTFSRRFTSWFAWGGMLFGSDFPQIVSSWFVGWAFPMYWLGDIVIYTLLVMDKGTISLG